MKKWATRQNGGNYYPKTHTHTHTQRMKWNQGSLRDHWNNFKCDNICIIGVAEGKKKKKGLEKIFEEIIAENFLNMGKEIVNQVEEA